MKDKTNWLVEVPILAALLALLILSLPLLAAVSLVARFAFVAAVLLVVVVFALSPRFRRWLGTWSEERIDYKGLRLGTDVALSAGHSWARVAGGEVEVGADDLVQATLGPVEAVDLPRSGTRVRRGERLFRLWRGNRSVDVRAPVSGTVVSTNDGLRERPGLVNEEPFREGWVVRLAGDDTRRERRSLLRGSRAWDWFRSEVDLLVTVLTGSPATPSLADGGAFVSELFHQLDDETWERVRRDFFEPRAATPDELPADLRRSVPDAGA